MVVGGDRQLSEGGFLRDHPDKAYNRRRATVARQIIIAPAPLLSFFSFICQSSIRPHLGSGIMATPRS